MIFSLNFCIYCKKYDLFFWKIVVKCETSNVRRALSQHTLLIGTFHISRFRACQCGYAQPRKIEMTALQKEQMQAEKRVAAKAGRAATLTIGSS